MKKVFFIIVFLFFVNSFLFAQQSGNRIYGNRGFNTTIKKLSNNKGNLVGEYPDNLKYSIEASVLVNLKPDEFVAVFGVQQEAKTAQQSNTKVNGQIDKFKLALNKLGVKPDNVYVDFITQNRIYDFKPSGANVIETLAGFETKKTVAIRYKDSDLFEKLVTAAANEGIFDLIKVDYIVSDFESTQKRLFEEAVKIVKNKKEKYEKSFDLKLKPLGVENEKYQAFYPADRYEKYQAYESGQAYTSYRNGQRIYKRKSATFFYEPLNASKFDKVLTPIGIEPLVQITIYIRMNYLTESAPQAKSAKT